MGVGRRSLDVVAIEDLDRRAVVGFVVEDECFADRAEMCAQFVGVAVLPRRALFARLADLTLALSTPWSRCSETS